MKFIDVIFIDFVPICLNSQMTLLLFGFLSQVFCKKVFDVSGTGINLNTPLSSSLKR